MSSTSATSTQLQVDDELPLYVIPAPTPERNAAVWAEQRARADAALATH
jgi:hypothetical protein